MIPVGVVLWWLSLHRSRLVTWVGLPVIRQTALILAAFDWWPKSGWKRANFFAAIPPFRLFLDTLESEKGTGLVAALIATAREGSGCGFSERLNWPSGGAAFIW